MKSSLDVLTKAEKEALALFYETAGYKALEKFAKEECIGLGADALQSQDHSQTRYLAGKAAAYVELIKMLKANSHES